jgi:glycine betaine catabolism B
VFIAGGIGVTPFRSMIKNMIENGTRRDAVLFYSAANTDEFVYKDIFKKAEELGVKSVYVYGGKEAPPKGWVGETGYITEAMIKKYAPDFKERTFYLSGPIAMVNNYKALLSGMGIGNLKIVTDYFPGF